MSYSSTKTYTHAEGLSAAFRQWRADSHCQYLHGYALEVRIVFTTTRLDDRNWVVDFGGLKEIKQWLKDTFDHKTLVAADDPLLEDFRQLEEAGGCQLTILPNVGCEAFAEHIHEKVSDWLTTSYLPAEIKRVPSLAPDHFAGLQAPMPRVWLASVEVREHAGNSAIYR